MIKHIGEELTPFAACGFARTPELPLTGEHVTVHCRVDRNPNPPVLHLRAARKDRTICGTLTGRTEASSFYAFSLGSFPICQTVAYQIVAGAEATPWYSFDVLRQERIEQARAIHAGAGRMQLLLGDDLTLTLLSDGSVVLEQKSALAKDDEPLLPFPRLPLWDGACLETGPRFLWRLKRLSNVLYEIRAYTVLRDALGRVRKVTQEASVSCRHVMGTGERFNAVDQQGRGTNGRVMEKFTHQGDQTYLPVPFFMTEQRWGLYRMGSIPAAMGFGVMMTIEQETESSLLCEDRLLLGDPAHMLEQYLSLSGLPALPPEWAFGVWISGNGWNCGAEVDAQLAALRENAYPASVMVLEQWSDEQTFYLWHDQRFPAPADTVRRIRDAGLHLLLWQIPVIKHEWDHAPSDALRADIRQAMENGYAVQGADGAPYRITENWFHHSLLPDFTNPNARRWWFDKRKYLLDMGVEGFKTDGGEFLFEKAARLYDGASGLAAHNRYPMQYTTAYRDFMREHGVDGITFSRAGFSGAQTTPVHWAGDQKSEWSELQAQLYAGLSAGLSGILFWSFDIGGFAGPLPEGELYLRATAMGCFSPIMQWHSEPRGGQYGGEVQANNDRSPWNMARQLGDPSLLEIACSFARLREALRPYLWREAQACVSIGRPMMAHLCLDYPDDARAWNIDDQYLLGRSLLVAPVTEPGAKRRAVYLPQGRWRDYFSGEEYQGACDVLIPCPLNRIPVFVKEVTA